MDWKLLISELTSRGLSQPQIAAKVGCGQATISDLASARTKEPRHSLGQALIALHDCAVNSPQPTTEPAAAAMVPLLQSGLEKAEQALADEPTDRVARLIKRNRTQALAEIAATPQPTTTEPAAAGV